MRQHNNYRKINEDIAALRNIAWAAIKNGQKENRSSHIALVVHHVNAVMLQDAKDLAPETHAYNIRQIKESMVDY